MEETNIETFEPQEIKQEPVLSKKSNKVGYFVSIAALVLILVPVILKLNDNDSNLPEPIPQKSPNAVLPASARERPPTNLDSNNIPVSSDPNFKPTGVVREITISGKNYEFSPKVINANKGDVLRIVFINNQGKHDLVIDGYNLKTETIESGNSVSLNFVADKEGTFEYYCSVGEHRVQGMTGTLIVK